jgi:adenylosuccinate synthase
LFAVQTIPLPAFLYPQISVPVIGAGGLVNLEVLEKELAMLRESTGENVSLLIDPNCMVVSGRHIREEETTRGGRTLQGRIGSTCEGVGAALAEKIRRDGRAELVKDYDIELTKLGCRVVDTVSWLNTSTLPIYVEGTQGHLLSLHTSGFYPFCTSRECGPQGILTDVGISPFAAERFRSVAVFRTFPIRVGGNSGDMNGELTWEELSELTGGYVSTPEITTVTKRARRIARWDMDRNLRTVQETRPTELAITFLDYLFPENASVSNPASLSNRCLKWLGAVQRSLQTPITYVSTGPGQENAFRISLL